MKLHTYICCFSALAAVTVSGCKDADIDGVHHYDNKLYISSAPITDDLLIKPSVKSTSREITYRLAAPAVNDVQISFEAVPSMTASYNLIYGDSATALPAQYYDIPEKTVTIKAGDISGNDIAVNFENTDELDKSRRYVLPVTIVNTIGIDVLASARTAYFIFKGAALINVVANIRKIYFPINWKSDVSNLPVVTVETLVHSSDWTDGRGNALSSIFGIEGEFLVRVGDSDRPRDQLQVVAPGGNFPGANVVPGLPVNEWVHIAVVYNSETQERIYYKNGVQVYEDGAATVALSLTADCYIGKSWNDERWLPGDVSEVRIWSVERTADQIKNDPYEVDPASEGLVAYWKFNEGIGNTIADQTGNGNNITASGDPEWIPVEIPEIN